MKHLNLIKFLFILSLAWACNNSSNKEEFLYPDGTIRYVVPLKEGLRNGKLKQYYENGNLELQSIWVNGKKHGKLVSYYKNGNKKTEEFFRNDMRQDTLKVYDSLGNISEVFLYTDNVKKGPYFQFYPTGQVKIKGGIMNEKKHGKAVTYYPDGNIKRREIYDSGELVYTVDYTKNGVPYDILLPVSIVNSDSNSIKISLDHSFYENGYIGVIFGPLDSKGQLLDTLDKASSKNLEINYQYTSSTIKNDTISGIVYEINDNLIETEYPFKFNVNN